MPRVTEVDFVVAKNPDATLAQLLSHGRTSPAASAIIGKRSFATLAHVANVSAYDLRGDLVEAIFDAGRLTKERRPASG